jgi:flagellar motor switch protein FliG
MTTGSTGSTGTAGNNGLQGTQRVAAFLLSLDAEIAKKVIGSLAPDVVEAVAQAMLELPADLGAPGKVQDLHRELALGLNSQKRVQACRESELEPLLAASLGAERSKKVLAAIKERRLQERPFMELEAADPYAVGKQLAQESPAVAAVVVAHLAPSFSAAALNAFEREKALEIVKRVATLTPPPFPVLRRIAQRLAARTAETAGDPRPPDGKARLKTVAELLSNTTPEMEKSVIDSIQAEDAQMASDIREFLFTWEDIGTIDKRSMQKFLGAVDTKTLSLALKGASAAVEQNVMANLSQRVRDMVKEERELVGAVPLSEVLAGREEVLRGVRALIESGEFRPTRGGDDLVS